jgi:hypothetical protein
MPSLIVEAPMLLEDDLAVARASPRFSTTAAQSVVDTRHDLSLSTIVAPDIVLPNLKAWRPDTETMGSIPNAGIHRRAWERREGTITAEPGPKGRGPKKDILTNLVRRMAAWTD